MLGGCALALLGWLAIDLSKRPADVAGRDERLVNGLAVPTDGLSRQDGNGQPEQMDPAQRAKYEAAMAYAKRETEKQYEMGMMVRDNANFDFVDADGTVTAEALEHAGVARNQRGAIQTVIDNLWKTMEGSMRNRMIRNPDKEGSSYLIPADRERGDALLSGLEQDLERLVGSASARILRSGLHSTSKFGWFGKFDVEVDVLPPQSDSMAGGKNRVHYRCLDPNTGTVIRQGRPEVGSESLKPMFGKNPSFD